MPFQGVFELLDQAAGTLGSVLFVILGALVGTFGAIASYDEIIEVAVEPDHVTITRGDEVIPVDRPQVEAVFVEGKDLVLTDSRGGELVRRKQDHDVSRLRDAFTRMNYPWHDAHPFEDAYTRWAPGMPGLPDGADAHLRERQVALEKGRGAEARELRRELGRLGVFVRDVKKKQYWRLAG